MVQAQETRESLIYGVFLSLLSPVDLTEISARYTGQQLLMDIQSQAQPKVGKTNILLGCTIGVISSACQSIGLILQRKSHLIHNDAKDLGIVVPPYKRSLWHIGFLLFIISNIFGSSIQITTLPLIVLSPLQSIGLVFNTIFNALILHESFTAYSLIGTLLISLGALLIAFFGGSIREPEYDLDEFIKLMKEKNFIIWVVIDMFMVIACLLWIVISKAQWHNHGRRNVESNDKTTIKSYLAELLNIESHIKNLDTKIQSLYQDETIYESQNRSHLRIRFKISLYTSISRLLSYIHHKFFALSHEKQNKIQGLLFGVTSGTLSAYSLLLAKSTIEILLLMFVNKKLKQLNHLTTYLLLISFFTLCLSQLYLLNQGLKNISTSVLYPLVFCIYNITNISNGLIFYQQWREILGITGLLIVIGTFLVITGVFILSWKHESLNTSSSTSSRGLHSNISTPLLANSTGNEYHMNEYGAISPSTPRKARLWKPNVDEQVLTSMASLTNPQDPTSPYYDPNNQLSPTNSIIVPTTSSVSSPLLNNINTTNNIISSVGNNNNNQSEKLKPFLRKTSDNLNHAGKRVSHFIRRSIDTINSHVSSDSQESPIRARITSSNTILSPIISQEADFEDANKSSEYVSFKDLKSSSSFKANQSANNLLDESDQNIIPNFGGKGLGISSISLNKKSSENNISQNSDNNIDVSQNEESRAQGIMPSFKPLNNITSPIESSTNSGVLSISPKTVASRSGLSLITNNLHNHLHPNHNHHPSSNGQKNYHSFNMKSEEDYNSNNSYNYSLHNTIEEIQNQMNAYNYQPYSQQSKVAPPLPLNHIIPPTVGSSTLNTSNSIQDLKDPSSSNHNKGSSSSNNSTNTLNTTIATTTTTTTQLYSSTSKYSKRNFTTTGVLKRDGLNFGKRVYSFEQNELLSELRN